MNEKYKDTNNNLIMSHIDILLMSCLHQLLTMHLPLQTWAPWTIKPTHHIPCHVHSHPITAHTWMQSTPHTYKHAHYMFTLNSICSALTFHLTYEAFHLFAISGFDSVVFNKKILCNCCHPCHLTKYFAYHIKTK